MKRPIIFLLALIPFVALATDPSQIEPDPSGIWGVGWSAILTTVIIIYEMFVRYIPTASNWSVLSLVIKVIRFLIPNRNKMGDTFNNYPKSIWQRLNGWIK
jgi:hypothetical protein